VLDADGAYLDLIAIVLEQDAVVVDGLWMDDAAEVEVHSGCRQSD